MANTQHVAFYCCCINYEEALERTMIVVVSVNLPAKENLSSSLNFAFALAKSMLFCLVHSDSLH